MPEGDTIYRIADVMRQALHDDRVVATRGRSNGPRLERLVGARVVSVSTRGKHLLIGFENGLTLHTHLQMRGTWHRYRPGERWRLPPSQAVAVLETGSHTVVCFRAPTVELLATRALPLHPVLSRLGPDLLDPGWDVDEAVRRFLAGRRTVAETLLDQRVVAGVGNVYRNEVLAERMVDPFIRPSELGAVDARHLLTTAASMLRANTDGGVRATVPHARRGERWVYRRAGRPCRRCGTTIRSSSIGQPPRRLYWCPRCQRRQTPAA